MPKRNLLLMADLWHLLKPQGRQRAAELLDLFDLTDTAKKPAYTFSGRMQRRLDLAMTLVGSPRIIFLDEPTTGLHSPVRCGTSCAISSAARRSRSSLLRNT